jgi:hypothetical protein
MSRSIEHIFQVIGPNKRVVWWWEKGRKMYARQVWVPKPGVWAVDEVHPDPYMLGARRDQDVR